MLKNMGDEKILSYNDVVLRQSDLGILNGPHYLNDRIIEFYFSFLSSQYPFKNISLVPPAIAFWIMNCPDKESLNDFLKPLDLPSKELVLFPVNDNDDVTEAEGGSHWSLLVFERGANVFVHHDSFRGLNRRPAKLIYETILPYMGIVQEGSNGEYMECPSSPSQVNGYDCGLYVLAIARVICCWFECCRFEGAEFEVQDLWFCDVKEQVTPSAVSQMRKDILALISSLRGTD